MKVFTQKEIQETILKNPLLYGVRIGLDCEELKLYEKEMFDDLGCSLFELAGQINAARPQQTVYPRAKATKDKLVVVFHKKFKEDGEEILNNVILFNSKKEILKRKKENEKLWNSFNPLSV